MILDSNDEAVCIVRTTAVSVLPFDHVNEDHAYKEGEGDRSLTYWREVHQTFFAREMKAYGLTFHPSMNIVCEEFTLVYGKANDVRRMKQ